MNFSINRRSIYSDKSIETRLAVPTEYRHEKDKLVITLLDAIGLIAIVMAVFDVSRFLLEEEVFHDRELGVTMAARKTLTKFLVIITIAISLEALAFIFTTGKKDISMLIYPTFLLFAAALLVISLGMYQKFSGQKEHAPKQTP